MKTASHKAAGVNRISHVDLLRMRAVAAEATLKEARETLSQAKRRRKLARMLAKRAKKDAKQAKANLAQIREALAQLEARITTERQGASRKKTTRIKSAKRAAARKGPTATRTRARPPNSRSVGDSRIEPTLAPMESENVAESIDSQSETSEEETPVTHKQTAP